jgi:hypothetical protein
MRFLSLLCLFSLCITCLWHCSPERSALNWLRQTERRWQKLQKQQPEWLETLDSLQWQKQGQFLENALQNAETWLAKPIDAAIKKKLSTLQKKLSQAKAELARQSSDARVYNLAFRLQNLASADTTFSAATLAALDLQLGAARAYYNRAHQKLQNPQPSLCDSAVLQHIRGMTYLREGLQPKLAQLPQAKGLAEKMEAAYVPMKDYLAWCRAKVLEGR